MLNKFKRASAAFNNNPSSYNSYNSSMNRSSGRMTFKKKLALAGLAVGVTSYMLYKASKKREKERLQIQNTPVTPYQYGQQSAPPQQQSSGGHNYAAMGAGAAAVAGAGYMAHQYSQSSSQPPPPPEYNGELSWAELRDWKVIARLLAACVADQYLYAWYDWNKVEHIAKVIASNGALYDIAEEWQLPPFLAQDLVKLALFDVMFLLDDSASMRSEGRMRRDGLKAILKRAADAAGRLDPDGMEVAWMNTDLPPGMGKIHNHNEAEQLADSCQYDGRATPMGWALETKLLGPHLYGPLQSGYLNKPVLAIVITDGRPTGKTESGERIVQVIRQAKDRLKNSQWGEDALSVTIAAVGNDREAQDWLDGIDSHPVVGDLVDVCSDIRIEAEQVRRATGLELTPDLHCLKLLLGAIDSQYDASDEPPSGKWSSRDREKEAKDQRFAGQRAALAAGRDAALGPPGGYGGHQQGGDAKRSSGGYASGSSYDQQQPVYNYGAPSGPPPPQQQQYGGYGAPSGPPPPNYGGYGQQPPPHQGYGGYPQQQQYGALPGPPPGQYYGGGKY